MPFFSLFGVSSDNLDSKVSNGTWEKKEDGNAGRQTEEEDGLCIILISLLKCLGFRAQQKFEVKWLLFPYLSPVAMQLDGFMMLSVAGFATTKEEDNETNRK